MNIATITAAATPAATAAQTPATSVVAVITQTPGLTGLLPVRRSGGRAGFGGPARSDPAGMPAVTAVSSAWVRAASAWPTRASSSPAVSWPRTNAALTLSITYSRSACDARRRPGPVPAAATSSPGPVIIRASPAWDAAKA